VLKNCCFMLTIFMVANLFAQVNIDNDGMIKIDDQRTFIIGSYHLPKSEAPYAELANAGFNLVRSAATNEALDAAHEHGLKVWYGIGAVDLDNERESREKLTQSVEAFKSHPALLARETVDEPAWTWNEAGARVAPKPIIDAYKLAKSIDPNHILYLNHAPVNLVSTMQKYNAGTDIVACDIYPVIPHGIRPMFALFPDGIQGDLLNTSISQVGEYADKMRRVAGPDKPMFIILQGFSWEMLRKEEERDSSKILYPTWDQSRFMAYDAIIHGANGILYWGTSYTPQPSPFWSDLKRVTAELSSLKHVLAAKQFSLELEKTYHELGHSIDAGVEVLLKKVDGEIFVFAANADRNPVKVTLAGLPAALSLDVFNENRSVAMNAGAFTDTFEPFAVHVYRMATK
jgi:hypothetical protein